MTRLMPRPHRPRFEGPQRRFGDYVRECRLSRRIGLRACAEAIGLAAGHYSNIENGRAGPPDEPTLVKLAEILDVPVGALLSRAGRLSPTDLQRFWSSPAIPGLIVASTGWTPDESLIFQEIILASLANTPARPQNVTDPPSVISSTLFS
jgi:transcriptional regulator with XRE-family HTH domain